MSKIGAAVSAGLIVLSATGAIAQDAFPTRPNTLEGHAACAGYTVENYKTRFSENADGPDAQLHSLCAGAYNYYWMYLNAIRKGFSEADCNRTYDAFDRAAKGVKNFWAETH